MPKHCVWLAAWCAFLLSLSACGSSTDDVQTPAPAGDTVANNVSIADSAWYNTGMLRGWFGGFEPLQDIQVRNPALLQELQNRGDYLVHSVAACGVCHAGASASGAAPNLSGGKALRDDYGDVIAPNITPDKATGIGQWELGQLVRVLRSSIDREGRPEASEHHGRYRWMSDFDAKAISVYLLSQPPVSRPIKRRVLGALERNSWGLFSKHSDVLGYVPRVPEGGGVHSGRYLVRSVAGCFECHSSSDRVENLDQALRDGPLPVNGKELVGEKDSPLASWTGDDVVNYLRTGYTPSGAKIDGRACPWPSYQGMHDQDKRAIGLYLVSLAR